MHRVIITGSEITPNVTVIRRVVVKLELCILEAMSIEENNPVSIPQVNVFNRILKIFRSINSTTVL